MLVGLVYNCFVSFYGVADTVRLRGKLWLVHSRCFLTIEISCHGAQSKRLFMVWMDEGLLVITPWSPVACHTAKAVLLVVEKRVA